MTDYDYVVIGAGISGIAAAEALHRGSSSYVVLEKEDHAGGHVITRSIDGCAMDVGFIFGNSNYTSILSKVKQYGLEKKEHILSYTVIHNGEKVYSNTSPPPNSNLTAEALRFEELTRSIQQWWWLITFQTFCNYYGFDKDFRRFVLEPSLNILFITANSFKKPAVMVINLLKTFTRVIGKLPVLWSLKHGNIGIINAIVADKQLPIKLNHEVVLVVRQSSGCWRVRCRNNLNYTCRKVILACGPRTIQEILHKPSTSFLQRWMIDWAARNTRRCHGVLHTSGLAADTTDMYCFQSDDRGWTLSSSIEQQGLCDDPPRPMFFTISDDITMLPTEGVVERFAWYHPVQDRWDLLLLMVMKITQWVEGGGLYFAGAWTSCVGHEYAYVSGRTAVERALRSSKWPVGLFASLCLCVLVGVVLWETRC